MPEPELSGADTVVRARIWDPALRVFHWALAALVIAAWILAQVGPKDMSLHFWCGYAVAALLGFRVIWGFVGPATARFGHFVKGPGAVARYAATMTERKPSYWPGHNPLGAVSVIAMLAVLGFQIGTGLISDPEDYINIGPLAGRVAHDTATDAVGLHHLGAKLITILVVLHVAMIVFYKRWKREDLVRPMITGWKMVRGEER